MYIEIQKISDFIIACCSASTSWPYLETPAMILHSSTDTTIRFCHENNNSTEFWQKWKNELSDIAMEIAEVRPDLGMFILNCPFHGTIGHHYTNAEVPLVDSEDPDSRILLKEILYNFIKGTHPYQAIDDMSVMNPACPSI